MTESEFRSMDNLNLSWPHLVTYHLDDSANHDSITGDALEAQSPDTGSQEPVTTYNGVPREHIRNSQPLLGNEIRVLDLNSGILGMPLVGSLRRVRLPYPLSNKDVYEPLSYTWEDCDSVPRPVEDTEDDVHTALFLMDSDCSVKLTSNCANALRTVRKAETDRTIWVDSICVNQDDPEERSRQVDLMKKIYANAFTVLAYLGRESTEDDGPSTVAMSLLRQTNRDFYCLDQREKASVRRLFERRYFQRMWIVQEVTLAQTLELHCGPDAAYISEFAGNSLRPIMWSQVTPPWLRHSKQATSALSSVHQGSQAEQVLGLIFDTASCNCKDDRDRIFAILSLLNISDKERLKADYNWSTAQIFTGIAAYLATNGFLWCVLMLAPRLAVSSCLGLPSWVPDWSSLGKAGLEDLKNLKLKVLKVDDLGPGSTFGVASSGSITVRGMLLGSVIIEDDSWKEHFNNNGIYKGERSATPRHAKIIQGERLATIRGAWKTALSSSSHGDVFVWTLAKPIQHKSLDPWQCHFCFTTSCKPSKNAQHSAVLLPDYSTVLILRPHSTLRDQFTLVEIGVPQVGGVLPRDWGGSEAVPHIPFDLPRRISDLKQSHLDVLHSSQEALPRLSNFPELWSFNPSTFSMSLTHLAIQQIQCIDMGELVLLHRWQEHGRIGIQILRDRIRLRRLIDEVNSLGHEDYIQREHAAGLDYDWSLGDFLGLFINDPHNSTPTERPHVQLHGNQPLDEADMLAQLMRWAQVTLQVLLQFRKTNATDFPWTEHTMDGMLHANAMAVALFLISYAGVLSKRAQYRGPGRTSILLEKIWRQLPDVANPDREPVQRSPFKGECYFDWRRFNRVMQQRLSVLNDIRPEVERIQAELCDFQPDLKTVTAHQVFAAHGVDLTKDNFTQIRIR